MSKETSGLFNKVLGVLIENEKASEALRQKYFGRPEITMNDNFSVLDLEDNSLLSPEGFCAFLRLHGLRPEKLDIQGLLDKFNNPAKGRVSYSDFVAETLPRSPQKYSL